MSASSPSSPPHSPTVQAPSVPDPYEDEYVVRPGPHYASGSFILFEADVDAAWVAARLRSGASPSSDGPGAPEDPWRSGTLPIARRATQTDSSKRQVLTEEEVRKHHDSVTAALGRSSFRWHRHGRWVVRPTGRVGVKAEDLERQRAALVITGLELLTVDPRVSALNPTEEQRRVAGVVIAHIDLTESSHAVASGFASHLLADDMRNGIGGLLGQYRTALAAQITTWLNQREDSDAVTIKAPATASTSPSDYPIQLCQSDWQRQASVPSYAILTGLWPEAKDAIESLGEYRYGEKGIAARPSKPQELPTLDLVEVRRCHADRLAGWTPLSPTTTPTTGSRQSPELLYEVENEEEAQALPFHRSARGDWASSFGTTGAGFAYVPKKEVSNGKILYPPLRNQLSSVYSTVLALEMLKDHALTGFARASLDLSHRLQEIDSSSPQPLTAPGRLGEGSDNLAPATSLAETPAVTPAAREERLSQARDEAVRLWRAFVAFTTEYWALTDTMPAAHQEVVARFQKAINRDTEKMLSRTQDNLQRIASLLELEESRARAEREREEDLAEKESADRERRFNVLVGFLATLFLPLSVIPPILEWYYPNDGRHALGTHWLWLLGITALMVAGAAAWLHQDIVSWWRSRRTSAH